jgi:hypothetical protein
MRVPLRPVLAAAFVAGVAGATRKRLPKHYHEERGSILFISEMSFPPFQDVIQGRICVDRNQPGYAIFDCERLATKPPPGSLAAETSFLVSFDGVYRQSVQRQGVARHAARLKSLLEPHDGAIRRRRRSQLGCTFQLACTDIPVRGCATEKRIRPPENFSHLLAERASECCSITRSEEVKVNGRKL